MLMTDNGTISLESGPGNATKLWIDGVRDTTEDSVLSGTIGTSGSDPVTIGAQINEGTLRRQWIGSIDEVRIYNRALSDDEVQKLYSSLPGEEDESKPFVSVPASKYLVWDGSKVEIDLDGVIYDDGMPLPANPSDPDPNETNKLTWWWEISGPAEANQPVLETDNPDDLSGSAYVYDDPNQIITVSPKVTLEKQGYYEFSLYASDGENTSHATMAVSLYPGPMREFRENGYLYLSPLPDASYVSTQTKYLIGNSKCDLICFKKFPRRRIPSAKDRFKFTF